MTASQVQHFPLKNSHSHKPVRQGALLFCLLLCLLTGPLFAQEKEEIQFEQDINVLTKHSHRLSGTPENREAADYVEKRLREIGIQTIITQPFLMPQTFVKRCELKTGDGRTLSLFPARPNGIIPPVTPKKGIRGILIDCGKGTSEDFKESPAGKIAVLRYYSESAWIKAFRMGAQAVIFTRDPDMKNGGSHFVPANANLLRFYYDGPVEDLPMGSEVTLHSEVVWKQTSGKNIFAFIKGTNPEFFLKTGDTGVQETVILAATLDTFGAIPRLSPGARSAADCASLLNLAAFFQHSPPRRNILISFFDNEARAHQGASVFYKTFASKSTDAFIEKRADSLKNEQNCAEALFKTVAMRNPLAPDAPARKDLLRLLRQKADAKTAELKGIISAIRLSYREQAKKTRKTDTAGLEKALAPYMKEKDGWNSFKRAIAKDKIDESVSKEFEFSLKQIRTDIDNWQKELNLRDDALVADFKLYHLLENQAIVLHSSLLLGDNTSKWGLLMSGGGSDVFSSKTDLGGLYGRIRVAFLNSYQRLQKQNRIPTTFEDFTVHGLLEPPNAFFFGSSTYHSGAPAGRVGIYNIAFVTAHQEFNLESTPDNTKERLNLQVILSQAKDIGILLHETANGDALSSKASIQKNAYYVEPKFTKSFRKYGPSVYAKTEGRAIADQIMPRAVIQMGNRQSPKILETHYAFAPSNDDHDDFILTMSGQSGLFGSGPWEVASPRNTRYTAFAAAFDKRGEVAFTSSISNEFKSPSPWERIELFPVHHGAVIIPPQLNPDKALVFNGDSNSLLQDNKSWVRLQEGVLHWFSGKDVKRVKFFGDNSILAVNLDKKEKHQSSDSKDERFGTGFDQTAGWTPIPSAFQCAEDTIAIDNIRLGKLRDRGIMNASIDKIHDEAEEFLKLAQKTTAPLEAEAKATSAYLLERLVYRDTRNSIKDLVTAVLFLLLLNIPFSFAMERLLIGTSNIYRQVLWFGLFFILSFMGLYFSHPAFAISAMPMVIFLGFTIVILSMLVIFIIMQRFEVEIKALQGMKSTVHAADVSRFNTILAAMHMGISTMRRRPLRTALSAVTIILLTFTILCFASFGNSSGIVPIFKKSSPGYFGVFFHRLDWRAINIDVLDYINGRWGKDATVACRYWHTPEKMSSQNTEITGYVLSPLKENGKDPVVMRGLMSFDLKELEYRPKIKKQLGWDETQGDKIVWITEIVANRLGVHEGDPIRLGNQTLTVGKFLKASNLLNTTDMDGSNILPVDLLTEAPEQDRGAGAKADLEGQKDRGWDYLPADSVAIVPSGVWHGSLRAVHIYADTAEKTTEIANELTMAFDAPVYATRSDGVYAHVFGSVLGAAGIKDLFFPILLGGLVIFGTMLGSVADREKEIYTFSALGLAPTHVASLFFAEAMVYSIIGGVGGYLFSQILLEFFTFLAEHGLLTLPEMNYSSTNAIFTLLTVMATVLISAVYPAIKASRSANPGVMRKWKLPRPNQDHWEIQFPFTVSEYDITGVVSFLKEHFDNYSDTGVGSFMAENPDYYFRSGKQIGLRSKVSIAPFDLGVTQNFKLYSTPSEVAGIDMVKIELERISGQPKDWERLNKVFMEDLRKQFLIWRSLAPETMQMYRTRTLTELGKRNKESTATT